jgi:sugar phosphate isomerase/epimerase
VSDSSTTPSRAKVLLSTSSVYPETTASGFELAAALGYDGVELMVGIDPVAADIDAVEKLRDYHGVPVLAVHAPCLLVTQGTWGNDPWEKLARSAEASQRLGADTVVVHPPFRWQGTYASGFEAGIRRLNDDTGIRFCVENMYPWRTPVRNFKAYLPSWDPSALDYEYLTLDLSHASTAKAQSLDLARSWGERLRHVHLTDGSGSAMDEHLLPGQGDQRADEVLSHLVDIGFDGHVVLEVNTRTIGSRGAREHALADSLTFIRTHLGQLAPAATS